MQEFLDVANQFVSIYFNSVNAIERRLLHRNAHPCVAGDLCEIVLALRNTALHSTNRFAPRALSTDLPPAMDRWAHIVVNSRYGKHVYCQAVNVLQNRRCCMACQQQLLHLDYLPVLTLNEHGATCGVEYDSYMQVFAALNATRNSS